MSDILTLIPNIMQAINPPYPSLMINSNIKQKVREDNANIDGNIL